jgi:hypothetical protein
MLFLLAALLLTQPDETERLLIRAIELHQSGDVEAAVPEYQAYLAVRPKNSGALKPGSGLRAARTIRTPFNSTGRRWR